MVTRSGIRMLTRGVILCYLLSAVFQEDGFTANAQGPDDGTRYLDRREMEVKWIAGNASSNDALDCGGLDGCTLATCSRVTCNPITNGRKSLQCIKTFINDYFAQCPTGACNNNLLVDYSRSFVRLPPPASTLDLPPGVPRDICLQRLLDVTFKAISFPANFSHVYFGSTSGAFRSFPGSEQNATQCAAYDPRWRPWFQNGISVLRDVKVLVDVANSMSKPVTPEYNFPSGTTYLDVAKQMTLTLLQTFSLGDYVEVVGFDGGSARSLGGAFAVTSWYNQFDPSGRPELADLVSNVSRLAASSVAGAPSDLNGALRTAANSFNQIQSLKIIIVLSNGLFIVNSTTFPATDLQSNKAKLMVYKLPTNDDGGDTYLLKTTLPQDICSVKGSFESVDALAITNPLYAMRRYFTYLARIQLGAVGANITWSNKFLSVSQSSDVITPTYPAFGSDGLLIGVAAIDVAIDSLGEPLKTLVLRGFTDRNRGTLEAPAVVPMTCYYQNSSVISTCQGSNLPYSSAICPKTDNSSSLADRTCCGACGSGDDNRDRLKPWGVALIVIAVTALVLGAVGIGLCLHRKRKQSRDKQPDKSDFPPWQGGDSEQWKNSG